MNLSIQALGMGHKHAAEVLRSGRSIPHNLETCFKNRDSEKAKSIADPKKIDAAYNIVIDGAEEKIQADERKNWYTWAKPKRHKTSPDLGAENAFKEFYKGEELSKEEEVILMGALAIKIEEELAELKKIRDTIRI